MKPLILIFLITMCCAGFADACHYCDSHYAERVIVSGPYCQGATIIHYSNPCYPPCGPYYAPYPYVYEERHYVYPYPYPSSGYNFQFGYTSGGDHGRGHGGHHGGGHGDGYSFSIGGFRIGR